MNILKDKTYRQFNRTSRYSSIPVYYNTMDDKYQVGITKLIDKDGEYYLYTPQPGETFDDIAFKYYGAPDLYWAIADRNNCTDAFIEVCRHYLKVKVPAKTSIKFK